MSWRQLLASESGLFRIVKIANGICVVLMWGALGDIVSSSLFQDIPQRLPFVTRGNALIAIQKKEGDGVFVLRRVFKDPPEEDSDGLVLRRGFWG
jgi:hypothetical protein